MRPRTALALLAALALAWFAWSQWEPEPQEPSAKEDAPTGAEAGALLQAGAKTPEPESKPGAPVDPSDGDDAPAPADHDYGLDALVTDPDGVPVAGLRVEVYGSSGEDLGFDFSVLGHTDGEGRTRLAWSKADYDGRVAAEFEICHSLSEDGLPLSGDIRTHPLVRLEFPSYAHANVHVIRPDGKPVGTTMKVERRRATPRPRFYATRVAPVRRSTSMAKFRFLPTDEELVFQATGGKVFFPGPPTSVGPLAPRSTLEFKLKTGPRRPVLTAVLLDSDGKPLTRTKVGVFFLDMPAGSSADEVRAAPAPGRPTLIETDWQGRFRAAVLRAPRNGRHRWLRIQRRTPGSRDKAERGTIHMDYENMPAQENVVDLGELKLP